jgi:hypothetical protein
MPQKVGPWDIAKNTLTALALPAKIGWFWSRRGENSVFRRLPEEKAFEIPEKLTQGRRGRNPLFLRETKIQLQVDGTRKQIFESNTSTYAS